VSYRSTVICIAVLALAAPAGHLAFPTGNVLRIVSPDGRVGGPVEQVTPDASFYAESIPLGVDAAGNAIVGWASGSGNEMRVRTRACDPPPASCERRTSSRTTSP
jgi:hypothetical protein